MPAKKAIRKKGSSTNAQAKSGTKKTPRSTATKQSGHRMIDHQEIQAWAEERGARPSCVKKTGGEDDVGMIRLDFPGYSGEESLQEISWDDWFDKFEESKLALVVQDQTASGEKSNFNKLVKRTAAEKKPRTRAAG
ncbi:MAG TPA: hypothetical protein VKU19_21205 [Bryobacteraceae bacterium]|nr:hypothetical protein [Bryobacteraceae bacterium]